jgi:formylmethanofuran dehydrogenase subunit C
MTKLILTLKEQPSVPLEAESISPDTTATLTHEQICALPVYLGKRQLRLDDFFDVQGACSDQLEIHGAADKVKWIGRGMARGRINVVGNAGMHVGSGMKGGTIEVSGNVSDWLGAEMTGGWIRVHGNAGGQIGAAYRGSQTGMRGGTIIVDGGAGLEVGMRMRRGIIVIGRTVRDFAGLQMKGGTLFLLGGAEIRTGAWMIRGTIVSCLPIKLLPTFSYSCTYEPTFLHLYASHLEQFGISIPNGLFRRYSGDSAVPGKGEILVSQDRVA